MEMNRRIIILMAIDAFVAIAAIFSAHLWRLGGRSASEAMIGEGLHKTALFVAVVLLLAFLGEIYKSHREAGIRETILRIAICLTLSLVMLFIVGYSFPSAGFDFPVLLSALVLFGTFQSLSHAGYRLYARFTGFANRVLILGSGSLAGHLGEIIPECEKNYILSGYIRCNEEDPQVPKECILENKDGLYETVMRERADKIVVSLSERRGVFPINDVMACKLSGVEVIDAPSFYEQVTGKLLLEGITPSWFIFSKGFKITAMRRVVKRVEDFVCAAVGIALTLPFLPLVALVIKLDSPGPVFFRQQRVGEREKLFTLYKFRTMGIDAEKQTGAVWAKEKDPRVTRVGRFFRKSRIDELPQLYNVLKGDMSLIGPRPERPEFVEKLKAMIPYYSERHFVKPGITGWAQVRYAYGASVEDALEKLRYDLYYIKNMSQLFDVVIILETVKVILFRRGSR